MAGETSAASSRDQKGLGYALLILITFNICDAASWPSGIKGSLGQATGFPRRLLRSHAFRLTRAGKPLGNQTYLGMHSVRIVQSRLTRAI